MHARVTQFRILPDKLENFRLASNSIRPIIRKQAGFRALLVLRTGEEAAPEATVVSVWDSHEALRGSEKNLFLYQAISRVLGYCEGFPLIKEYEVISSEFAGK